MSELPEKEKLREPDVCYEDFLLAIQKIKPTVSNADLDKQIKFTEEFGQEG
jgi:vacuolar protein-sorting-associated protein 4